MSHSSYAAYDNGFLARRRTSPIGIGGAIAIHVGVAAVVLLMPGMPIGDKLGYKPFVTVNIPIDRPPPRKAPPPSKRRETALKPLVDAPPPVVPRPSDSDFTAPRSDLRPMPGPFGPPQQPNEMPVPQPPMPQPVFVDSRMDPRFARNVQPDYPPARLREEEEGKVTVRVRIGTDGRVISIEQVAATHPEFWRATQAHALKAWRFIPATRDGVPVESVREMTVHFRMQQ